MMALHPVDSLGVAVSIELELLKAPDLDQLAGELVFRLRAAGLSDDVIARALLAPPPRVVDMQPW